MLKFSLIIPTRNRVPKLQACLAALTRLEYPRERFEVIVVNDGSSVSMEEVVQPFLNQLRGQLITQPHQGPAAARNRGARLAKGEFLVFTDDDCLPPTGWLQTLEAQFDQTPDHAVGGLLINGEPENLYSKASHQLLDYLYAYYNLKARPPSFFTSGNLAFPGDLFHKVGGFDTSFSVAGGEDREICDRWLHRGYRLSYVPEIVIYHTPSLHFFSFLRQHFNYGRGAFRFRECQSRRRKDRIRMEHPQFYLDLIKAPFFRERGISRYSQTGLLLSSQIANAFGFFWEWSRPA